MVVFSLFVCQGGCRLTPARRTLLHVVVPHRLVVNAVVALLSAVVVLLATPCMRNCMQQTFTRNQFSLLVTLCLTVQVHVQRGTDAMLAHCVWCALGCSSRCSHATTTTAHLLSDNFEHICSLPLRRRHGTFLITVDSTCRCTPCLLPCCAGCLPAGATPPAGDRHCTSTVTHTNAPSPVPSSLPSFPPSPCADLICSPMPCGWCFAADGTTLSAVASCRHSLPWASLRPLPP